MSKNILKDSNHYIEWLEKSIVDEHINYYDYSDFKNILPIGSGSYGNINRVNWKNTDHFFALKSFSDDKQTLEEIVKELKLHRSVNAHGNIIRFCGITKVETSEIQKYSLVLEYADSGTLNAYLSKNFNELSWNDKSHLAMQLASTLEFLHNNNIIHRDLHGNNILIHQKNIKLTDFGLSKKISEASSDISKVFGVLPYVDPKSFEDKENYKLNKKSDVYSIGVLFWQISSGYRPFREVDYGLNLMLSILTGKREKIIDGTPIKYSKLYTACWNYEPNKRPNMQEVVLILKEIISLEIVIYNLNEDKKIFFSSENYETNSESSKVSLDINNDLNINNSLVFNTMSNPSYITSTNINVCDVCDSRISSQDSSSIASVQTSLSSINLVESIYGAIVDKLIIYIIKKHDRGITFDQVQQLIDKKILQLNQNVNTLIYWLSKNQDKSQYIWFLGLFYYYNIGIEEENSIKAFELFSKAANNNYSIAQIYLAKCYYDGYGINRGKRMSFDWCEKSANNGSIIGKFYLGYCYEFGIGIMNNEKKSVYWYKEASKSGNTIAKLYLANNYRLGKGVDKDEMKAFEYYEILAKQEISDAQLELGNCFYNGIGTKIDKLQAKYWYEKAEDNGNIIAKNILKKHYNKKIRIETENTKKRKLCKILFFRNLSQLGLYCVGKILLKANYEKSFHYLQKAAGNGCEFAQFNLGKCYQLGTGVRKDTRKAFELYKKSAKQDNNSAQFQLIYCYNFGYGTEINRVKAFELIKIMAEKGDNDALYLLGIHYGYGIEITINKANNWYSRMLRYSKQVNAKLVLNVFYKLGYGTEVNNKIAFKLFKEAGKNGNAVAQYLLGNHYLTNNNKAKAFECYKKSADKGYIESQLQIGNCYFEGIGTEINKTKGIEIIKELAEKGESCSSQNYLGELYELGRSINKDLKQASYWYCKATENECTIAEYNLGKCYENGNGVEKDERKAFEYYKKSADQEYLYAQFQLGCCYSKGIGTIIDKTKAFESYKNAAGQGYLYAHFQLGNCYLNGIGTEVNKMKAFESYEKAANQGYKVAQYILGIYYQNRKSAEKDVVKALEYYKKSADQGYSYAQFQLGNCYLSGIGTGVDKTKAFELYKRASDKGHKVAQNNLRLSYENGKGTKTNLEKAVYIKAAETKNKISQYNLGECYELGNGVNRDETKEAFEYYKKYYKKSTENEFKEVDLKYGCHCLISKRSEINREKEFELYIDAHNSNFGNIINDLEFLKVSEMHDGST
ncbi:kinase-like domain-containing protein [Rhizophagus irregularis DAOM 181602=DAOM 197198]|nr:kinase-like domain-containing protein [Rhizophagus irregularis DAOM 181602=DAOM 197198]